MLNPEICSKLEQKGITPTPNRILVLDSLLKQQSAISLSGIVKDLNPTDRVSIYRSLRTFKKKGLVHSVDDGSGIPKYALCASDCTEDGHQDSHFHFYCQGCLETFCMADIRIPKIDLPANFSITELDLMVKGLCHKCS